jgi:predicted permease
MDVLQNRYDEARGRIFYRRLLDEIRAEAGIETAALAAYDPLNLLPTRAQAVTIEGYEPRRNEDLTFLANTISSDYFRTLRIGLVAGREFEDDDDETAAPVVIVNDTLAQRFWSDAAHAIGKRMLVGESGWRTVIGVASDIKYLQINESPRPYVYLPLFQTYRSSMNLYARSAGSTAALVDQLRASVAAIDPDLTLINARPLTEKITGTLIFYNFTATMLFVFGAAGILLAALGTYGLVSYTVTERTHEIGIRMALGASGLSVVRGFLRRGLRLGATGAAIGIVAALAVGRLISSLLFGVSPIDAASFATALAVVLGGVIVATVLPAWRAARIDPLSALRHH